MANKSSCHKPQKTQKNRVPPLPFLSRTESLISHDSLRFKSNRTIRTQIVWYLLKYNSVGRYELVCFRYRSNRELCDFNNYAETTEAWKSSLQSSPAIASRAANASISVITFHLHQNSVSKIPSVGPAKRQRLILKPAHAIPPSSRSTETPLKMSDDSIHHMTFSW